MKASWTAVARRGIACSSLGNLIHLDYGVLLTQSSVTELYWLLAQIADHKCCFCCCCCLQVYEAAVPTCPLIADGERVRVKGWNLHEAVKRMAPRCLRHISVAEPAVCRPVRFVVFFCQSVEKWPLAPGAAALVRAHLHSAFLWAMWTLCLWLPRCQAYLLTPPPATLHHPLNFPLEVHSVIVIRHGVCGFVTFFF